ncbi:MAG: helix-turn-helix domain-containing protein [Candidatus Hydrogenedentes bacterium]|nr:helix-turn-helix domain-containing protein [Candidatus Hydrogenedentota bacterium]
MNTVEFDRLAGAVQRDPVMRKLSRMAREITGSTLLILGQRNGEIVRIGLDGHESDLPPFCQAMRATEEGARRCSACRSLVAMRACYHGVSDYCCHGGISIVAAPAVKPAEAGGQFVVVSSCAYAAPDRRRGWQAARRHIKDVPIDKTKLRKVYQSLPELETEKQAVVKAIVDLAASALAELARSICAPNRTPATNVPAAAYSTRALDRDLREVFSQACEGSVTSRTVANGTSLSEIVTAIVAQNPAAPFTVANVARAARMTPNHFSSLFHRQTGTKFTAFLTEQRIALACKLLRDVTLDIGEVAARSGFPDGNYFSRRFKTITGHTPSEFRAHCR